MKIEDSIRLEHRNNLFKRNFDSSHRDSVACNNFNAIDL